jgi:hypothetical protein
VQSKGRSLAEGRTHFGPRLVHGRVRHARPRRPRRFSRAHSIHSRRPPDAIALLRADGIMNETVAPLAPGNFLASFRSSVLKPKLSPHPVRALPKLSEVCFSEPAGRVSTACRSRPVCLQWQTSHSSAVRRLRRVGPTVQHPMLNGRWCVYRHAP